MPLPLLPIAAGAVGVGAIALALRAKTSSDRAAILGQCDGIRTQIETLAATGGDPHQLETLRVQLSACARRAAAAGVPLSSDTTTLLPCRATLAYMDAQWQDYKRTSYLDTIARDNKRNAVISQGRSLVQCLNAALAAASSPAEVAAVLADVKSAIADSLDRANCLAAGTSGCGRFGVNETDGLTRGWADLAAVAIPLGATRWDANRFFHGSESIARQNEFWHLSGVSSTIIPPVAYWTDRQGRTRQTIDPNTPADDTIYGGVRLAAEQKARTFLSGVARAATSGRSSDLRAGLAPQIVIRT